MRVVFARLVVGVGLIAVPLGSAGCSRTVSEKETVTRRPDGTVTRDRQTVKERADGSRVIEKERRVAD